MPGAVLGVAVGVTAVRVWAEPPPPASPAATAMLTVLVAGAAAVAPALLAATRDPVGVLRTP